MGELLGRAKPSPVIRRCDALRVHPLPPIGIDAEPERWELAAEGQPLAAGQEIALTLVVETGGTRQSIPVKAPVKAVGAAAGHEHH